LKGVISILFVLAVLVTSFGSIHALSSSSTRTITTTWSSSLHGADYYWQALRGNKTACCSNGPLIDFPMIQSLGFNLIRLPLSWNIYEQNTTKYLGYMTEIANEADSLGLKVVYDFHTSSAGYEPSVFFPSSLALTYGTGCTFYTNWWEGKVVYAGYSGWNAEWITFMQPVLKDVNSHSSTIGYEILNEPNPCGASLSNLKSFEQYQANNFQANTNKSIVFMGPYVGLQLGEDEYVAPTGITNLVMDVHCYIEQYCGGYNFTMFQQDMAGVYGVGTKLGVPIWIGEWSVCNPAPCLVNESYSNRIVRAYNSAFQQYNFADTYWVWRYTGSLSNQYLLAPNNRSTWWMDSLLSQYATSTSSSTTTTTTTSSSSTISSSFSSYTTTTRTLTTTSSSSSSSSSSSFPPPSTTSVSTTSSSGKGPISQPWITGIIIAIVAIGATVIGLFLRRRS
jgi:hypothetical protein